MWRPQFSTKTLLWSVALFAAFFAGMALTARLSNDPVGMMQTVGVTSGAVGAIGAVMAIFGFAGSRRPDGA